VTGTTTAAYAMTIGGARRTGTEWLEVINPATEEPLAEVPLCTRALLDEAMAAAAEAYPSWRRDDHRRRRVLLDLAELLTRSASELAALLTAEQGKPLRHAEREVLGGAQWMRYFARIELPREVIQDDAAGRAEVVRRPLGVVAAITPWNYPLMLALAKLAPALRAGNTVVLKPSPYTPVATLRMIELLGELLPPGVVNAVCGTDELGEWVTNHPVPAKISFTGSTATGKRVALAAAGELKRLTLELGGNDAAIVLDDADPEAIADELFWGAFTNGGQLCCAVKRVYVPVSIHDKLAAALSTRASQMRIGDGADPSTQVGPLTNPAQLERVTELVEDARARGARVATGGERLRRRGYFYAPTVLTDTRDGFPVVDEEQFGPVLPIVRYESGLDAVAAANATQFGLSGSVWSSDPARAAAVAAELECGTVWINTHLVTGPHQPLCGWKCSGIGVENGRLGLESFTQPQVIRYAGTRPQGRDQR
jgi:acyl-CoA reductase-like NAD-dependent aldehyde dehydrogenase